MLVTPFFPVDRMTIVGTEVWGATDAETRALTDVAADGIIARLVETNLRPSLLSDLVLEFLWDFELHKLVLALVLVILVGGLLDRESLRAGFLPSLPSLQLQSEGFFLLRFLLGFLREHFWSVGEMVRAEVFLETELLHLAVVNSLRDHVLSPRPRPPPPHTHTIEQHNRSEERTKAGRPVVAVSQEEELVNSLFLTQRASVSAIRPLRNGVAAVAASCPHGIPSDMGIKDKTESLRTASLESMW